MVDCLIYINDLADIFGVSERTILSGDLKQNLVEAGNMKRTKFYICSHCGSIMQGMGNSQIICCGKQIEQLRVKETDDEHIIKISEVEDDYYIEFNHEKTKEHYISFVAYVRFGRVLTIGLYPEQDAAVRFPEMYGGKIYYYCNRHGLFEYQTKSR